MRRGVRRKFCRFVIVVSYIILVSLTVRLVFWQPCPDIDVVSVDTFPQSMKPLRRQIAIDEEEALVVAVRIDWHIYSPKVDGFNKAGVPANDFVNGLVGGQTTKPCSRRFLYNHCVSDMIPQNRSISDTRLTACRNMTYLRNLPRASLVITCTSGHMSVIVRAIHSLRRTTPTILLAEIILVHLPSSTDTDDNMWKTEESIHSQFPDVVFLRCDPMRGLRGARMMGVQNARGDVIVFLQIPFEVNINWLPPLLEPIAEDKDTVTCPVTDVIDPDTFEYKPNNHPYGERKGFNWRFEPLTFKRSPAESIKQHLPHTTPVLEQKVFAIHKSRFLEITEQHSGIHPLGGGEDIELSIKTWLCGGKVLIVPCSRIGVISGPLRTTMTFHDAQNYRLLVRNWFDDFDKFVLYQIGYGDKPLEIKSATSELKERLICKPFRWFLEKVNPELVEHFPPYIPSPGLGVIQSDLCRKCVSVVEIVDTSLVSLHPCLDPHSHLNYHVHLMEDGHIRVLEGKLCISLTRYGGVLFEPCSNVRTDQIWTYNKTSQLLRNTKTERCFQTTESCENGFFPTCDKLQRSSQKWLIVNDLDKLKPALSTTTGRPTTTVKIRRFD